MLFYEGSVDTVIKLEHVAYSYYDNLPALEDINLTIQAGERFAIIGANGSGKSTLLQIMNGLLYQTVGKYFFYGYEITPSLLRDKGFLRFFRERVGYVFQDSDVQLFCPTVMDELLYGPLQLGLSLKEATDRSFEVMKMLNIEAIKDRPSYMLSGGEKKKVAIGSILTMNPEVLLLDEPTNGLDPRTQCFLVELMFALHEAGKTLVIATHDLTLVDDLNPQVALLSEDHRLKKIGQASDILMDEELLLSVNLIHEHRHYNGPYIHRHRHAHYLFHKH